MAKNLNKIVAPKIVAAPKPSPSPVRQELTAVLKSNSKKK